MSETRKAVRNKRGRPREIDRQEVVHTALVLFEQRGYEQVTMNEIAQAVSASRRSLFRLFPSKADLVWDGIWEALALLKSRSADLAPASLSLSDLVDALLIPGMELLDSADNSSFARRRLLIIGGSPALFNHPAIHELQGALTEIIRTCVVAQEAPPELLANSLVSVVFASVLWWAKEGGERSAIKSMLSAFSAFSAFSGTRNSSSDSP